MFRKLTLRGAGRAVALAAAVLLTSFAPAMAQPVIDRKVVPAQLPNARAQATNIISEAGGLGAITPTTATLLIAAESGTADDLDNVVVTAWNVGDTLKVKADAGDTITLKHGTGNITTDTGTDFDLTDEAYVWLDVTASGVTLRRGGGASETITSLSALGALTSSSPAGAVRFIGAGGRSGAFVRTTDDISALVTADPENCVSYPDPAEPDGSSGGWIRQAWLERPKFLDAKWCGAIGDGDSANAAANTTAIQAAINLVASDLDGRGGEVFIAGHYVLNGLVIDDLQEAVTIAGLGLRDQEQFETFTYGPSVLEFHHTSGDAIRNKARSFTLRDIAIMSTSTREAAAYANTNNGVRCEGEDVAGEGPETKVYNCVLENVLVQGHPGHGVAIIGEGQGHELRRVASQENAGNGIVIDRGNLTGRTNFGTLPPGIINLSKTVTVNNGGNGLVIGNPSQPTNGAPYRVHIVNHESFYNASNASSRVANYDSWIDGEHIRIETSAFDGDTDATPTASHQGLYFAGRNISIKHSRFVRSQDKPLDINASTLTGGTNGVTIENLWVSPAVTTFIGLPDSSLSNVWIRQSYAANYTNLVDTTERDSNLIGNAYIWEPNAVFSRAALSITEPITVAGGSSTALRRNAVDGLVNIDGGSSVTAGGQIQVYGPSHASRPKEAVINADRTTVRSQNTATEFAHFDSGGVIFSVPSAIINFGSADFEINSGSPTLSSSIGGGRRTLWSLPDASTSSLQTETYAWASGTYTAQLVWANNGGGSGNVRWTMSAASIASGETMNVADSVSLSATSTAGAQDVLVFADLGDVTLTANELFFLRIQRIGGDGADTLTNDATLVGLFLIPQ